MPVDQSVSLRYSMILPCQSVSLSKIQYDITLSVSQPF